MPNGDHHKLIEQVLAWAAAQLRAGGHIRFTVFTIDEQGREGTFAADPSCFAGDSSRVDLAQRMRKRFRKADIVRYAIAAECWLTRPATPAGPLRDPQIGRHGGREEVVIVHVCDRRSATLHISTITRDEATGRATDLRAFTTTDDKESQLAGRFTNLLEGRLH
jgi:hypothetical protein